MNVVDPNVHMVEQVADALGPLAQDLVFVGGCATGLLLSDQGRAQIRATIDVDLVAEITGLGEYYALSARLRESGFIEHPEDLVCRWTLGRVIVDIMPTDSKLLGFSNRWYTEAVRDASIFELPSRRTIRLVTAPLLVATKLEAFYGRGRGDYMSSHDVEDIISVVDGRRELLAEVEHCNLDLQDYLRVEFEELLGDPSFVESINAHFLPDAASQARVPAAIATLRRLARI